MPISRRQFLLSSAGAAVGAIVPSYYFQALEFFERFNEPLLAAPRHVKQDLCVLNNMGELELCWGDPFAEPDPMTWREYFAVYDQDALKHPLETWGLEPSELDSSVGEEFLYDHWAMHNGPGASAHRILKSLDLGKDLTDGASPHGLEFFEDSNMVSMWRGVRVDDEITLSLLQQRLNDLGSGIRIVTGYAL